MVEEYRAVFRPDPEEEILPSNAPQAYLDLIRFKVRTDQLSTDATKALLSSIDISKIIHAVQGRIFPQNPPSPIETELATVTDWCINQGYIKTTPEAIAEIARLQFNIQYNLAPVSYPQNQNCIE